VAESDPQAEIKAMTRLAEALADLGEGARGRVLRWAVEHFGVSVGVIRVSRKPGEETELAAAWNDAELGELFAAADPQTEADRALVVGYWFQFVQGGADFASMSVNSSLKHLGHGVQNITRALDQLKRRKPQLVIQLRKSGTAKQARKKYKLTAAGRAAVEAMLGREKTGS
jgi:hypothetical protein